MATDAAIDRVNNELRRAFEKKRADLDRIEILAAGLAAFSAPIPNYEPRFQHLRRLTLASD
jgi:N-acetylglucosamine kinase-like BadF-type ATPase